MPYMEFWFSRQLSGKSLSLPSFLNTELPLIFTPSGIFALPYFELFISSSEISKKFKKDRGEHEWLSLDSSDKEATRLSPTGPGSRLPCLCPRPQGNPSVWEQKIGETHPLQPRARPQPKQKKTIASSTMRYAGHKGPEKTKYPGWNTRWYARPFESIHGSRVIPGMRFPEIKTAEFFSLKKTYSARKMFRLTSKKWWPSKKLREANIWWISQ